MLGVNKMNNAHAELQHVLGVKTLYKLYIDMSDNLMTVMLLHVTEILVLLVLLILPSKILRKQN